MEKSRFLRPDFMVALLAVVIGLCTMFVYIYQARIMSRQMHATVWPYLESSVGQGEKRLKISVENKGVGPAIVKRCYVLVDGKPYRDGLDRIDSLIRKLAGKAIDYNYTNVEPRVIAPGEEIAFLEFDEPSALHVLDSALKGHSIAMEICYCSVFDDCWLLKRGSVTPCSSCN
jgi:hypothetical protein